MLHEVPGVQALDLQPGDQLDCDDGIARWWFPDDVGHRMMNEEGALVWWATTDELAARVEAVRRDGRVRTVAGGPWVCEHADGCGCTPTEVTDEMIDAAVAGYWSDTPDGTDFRDCLRAAVEAAFAAHREGPS